jgi:DNA invertase Pin-like site-specific DNA recombinase
MSAKSVPVELLGRKAVVYVRHASKPQDRPFPDVQHGQIELVTAAKRHGFMNVELIDDDIGRSASGAAERPGFERLVADVCAGTVGAVACVDPSRLTRSVRDWHYLLGLCGLMKTLIIQTDGVYDPSCPDDRLLLGMRATISEWELEVIRSKGGWPYVHGGGRR